VTQEEDRDRCDRRTEVDGNFGDAMVSIPQSRNRLENKRGKDDEVPRRM